MDATTLAWITLALSAVNLAWVIAYSVYVVRRVRALSYWVVGEGLPVFARTFVLAVVQGGLGVARDAWDSIRAALNAIPPPSSAPAHLPGAEGDEPDKES